MWFLVLSGCLLFPSEERFEGDDPGECSDLADNDRDGLYDCDDSDCAASPECEDDGLLPGPGGGGGGGGTQTGAATGGTGTTTGGTATGSSTCGISVWDDFPADGVNDAFYLTTVELWFSTVIGDETVEVSQGGAPVSGTTTIDEDRIIFTPDAPLSPNTTYDVQYTWCGGTGVLDTTWTTSATGAPAPPAGLIGNVYEVGLNNGRWLEPPGLGSLLKGLVGDVSFWVAVTYADDSEITMMAALTTNGLAQDMCTPSIDFPVAADFSANPFFSIQSDALDLSIQGIGLTIEDVVLSGAFTPDGSAIDGVTVMGAIDTRPLADPAGDTACDQLVAIGVDCQECSDGSGPHCVSIVVDSIFAPEVPGATLVQVTQFDIDQAIGQGVCSGDSGGGYLCNVAGVGLGAGPIAYLVVLAATARRRRKD